MRRGDTWDTPEPLRSDTRSAPESVLVAIVRDAARTGRRPRPTRDAPATARVFGTRLPGDLRAMADARDFVALDRVVVGPWSVGPHAFVYPVSPSEPQPFEAALRSVRAMACALGGLLPVGRLEPSGVSLGAFVHGGGERAEVVTLDLRAGRAELVADGVAALASMGHLSGQVPAMASAHQRRLSFLSGRVRPVAELAPLGSRLARWLPAGPGAGIVLERAWWLVQLLGLAPGGLDEVAAGASLAARERPSFRAALASSAMRDAPMSAITWMFSLFFFGQDERLRVLLELARTSPSPLVLDARRVFRELLRGRRDLGYVPDALLLRAELRALLAPGSAPS